MHSDSLGSLFHLFSESLFLSLMLNKFEFPFLKGHSLVLFINIDPHEVFFCHFAMIFYFPSSSNLLKRAYFITSL